MPLAGTTVRHLQHGTCYAFPAKSTLFHRAPLALNRPIVHPNGISPSVGCSGWSRSGFTAARPTAAMCRRFDLHLGGR
jgi:hypothetical protein